MSLAVARTHLSYRRDNDVMDRREHRLTIRLSAAVVAALKALAKAHSRSLHGEVDGALRAYITRQKKRERKGAQWP